MKSSLRTFALSLLSFVVAFPFAANALATAPAYDAVPATLPPNMASLGYQATQTYEFGDHVRLAGTHRLLSAATITMSNWALASTPANIAFCAANPSRCSTSGFTWPITITFYSSHLGANGSPDTVLATKTQEVNVPWRPEADSTCSTPTAWRSPSDSQCYNGYAFNTVFDLSSLNVTLPDDVIVGVSYNTQSYGTAPTGVDGPYNSLNVGVEGTVSTGTDDNTDNVFWNTSTAAWYTDHGAAGVNIFRQDTAWAPYGTVALGINVVAQPQTITLAVLPGKTYGDADFTVSATSDSGLTPTLIASGSCSGSGTSPATITITGAGSCSIVATQAGDSIYLPATPVTQTFTVAQKALTISGVAVTPKEYDANTVATLTGTPVLVGVLPADTTNVTLDSSAMAGAYSDANVGTAKAVTLSGLVLGGSAAGNYSLSTATVSGDILARPITVTATTNTKVYDGNTTASALPTITSGSLAGTDSAVLTELYSDKNVGTGKTVIPAAVITDGNSGSNYAVTLVNDTASAITSKTLNVGISAITKIYDATTNATLQFTDDRVAGDMLTIAGTGKFADKNAQVGKVVTVLTVTKSGPDAPNYTMNVSGALVLADIVKGAPLTPVITAASKVYDTNATASATCAVTPMGSDVVTCSVGTAGFADQHAGTGKTVTATGITLGGADAANYSVLPTATGSANITPAPVTIAFTTTHKMYDATTAATIVTRTVTGNIAPDAVITATGGTATFVDKNVGVGKVVNATGFTLSNSDYAVATATPTTASITAKALSVTATGVNKVYDATTTALVVFGDNRILGDVFTVGGMAAFADKNIGTGKAVTITGITLTGADAGNYATNATTSTTANITAKALNLAVTAANKTYDGNTGATVTFSSDALAGDAVSFTDTSATFDTADVGTGKLVTVLGIAATGTDASNYTLATTTATTTAIISAAPVSGGGGGGGNGPVFGTTVIVPTVPTPGSTSNTGGQVLGAETFRFLINMRQGSRLAPDVTELQKVLIAHGYLKIAAPTGYFGPATLAAVKQYQSANSISMTGFVGPLTRAALNAGK